MLLAAITALLACSGSDTTVCANGAVCPRGLLCDSVSGGCVAPEQLSACDGAADGDSCEFLGTAGVCDRGVCLDGECGDGIRSQGEACDDGNTLDGDGCSGDCRSSEVCGNGIVDSELGEECDCGSEELSGECEQLNSDLAGASCRADCLAHCGDGIVNAVEECDSEPPTESCLDFGFSRGRTECSNGCNVATDGCRQFGVIPTDGPGIAGVNIEDLWASPDGSLFAVGGPTAAIRSGAGWLIHDLGSRVNAKAIHGLSSSDAIVVGSNPPAPPLAGDNAFVARFDGNRWGPLSPLPSALGFRSYEDVWMGASDDIIIVGQSVGVITADPGRVWHFDGTDWQKTDVPQAMRAVDGAGDLVIAVGDAGRYRIRKTGVWTTGKISGDPDLLAVWVVDGDSAFATGVGGAIWEYDGSSWSEHISPITAPFRSVVGRSATDVFVLGGASSVHYDGESWIPMTLDLTTSPRAATINGDRIELGGGSFLTAEIIDGVYGELDLEGAVGGAQQVAAAGGAVWAATNRYVFRWYQNALTQEFYGPSSNIVDLDAASADVAFYVRNQEVCRLQAGVGESCEPVAAGQEIRHVAVLADETRFAANSTRLFSRTDGSWSTFEVPLAVESDTIQDLDAADGRAYAVSRLGEVWVFDGSSWSLEIDLAAGNARTIWALDGDNIFVGGDAGEVWRKTAQGWRQDTLGVQRISAISGSSPSDVFAISPDNLHYFDGERWSRVKPPQRAMLDVFVTATDVFFMELGTTLGRLERPSPW